jgi:hypothetical protein
MMNTSGSLKDPDAITAEISVKSNNTVFVLSQWWTSLKALGSY